MCDNKGINSCLLSIGDSNIKAIKLLQNKHSTKIKTTPYPKKYIRMMMIIQICWTFKITSWWINSVHANTLPTWERGRKGALMLPDRNEAERETTKNKRNISKIKLSFEVNINDGSRYSLCLHKLNSTNCLFVDGNDADKLSVYCCC